MPTSHLNQYDRRAPKRRHGEIDSSSAMTSDSPRNRPAASPHERHEYDLRVILQGTAIPQHQRNALEHLVSTLRNIVHERGQEIRDRCSQIHDLKERLEEQERCIQDLKESLKSKEDKVRHMANVQDGMRRRIDELKRAAPASRTELFPTTRTSALTQNVNHLRERKRSLEAIVDEQNQTLELGRQVVQDQARKLDEMLEEKEKLKAQVASESAAREAVDEELRALHGQSGQSGGFESREAEYNECISVLKASAVEKDKTKQRLQAQLYDAISGNAVGQFNVEMHASNTLAMVHGLQHDLAERDGKIHTLEVERERREATVRLVEKLQCQMKEKDAEVGRANEKAVEARVIAEEQQRLIDKLLKVQ